MLSLLCMYAADYLDVVRNREALSMLSLVLECSVDHSVPRPVPQPLLSWYKDGEPVSFAQLGESAQLNESFLTAYPILNLGVFDVPSFQVFPDGRVILATNFNNITLPMLGNLSATTTLEQARELVFDVFCGNWTCLVSNSLGSSSVQYTVGECGKCFLLTQFALFNYALPIIMSFMQLISSHHPLVSSLSL